MFSEQELSDLERCVQITEAAIVNVSTRVAEAKKGDKYAAMSGQWVNEVTPIYLRAKAAIEREKKHD